MLFTFFHYFIFSSSVLLYGIGFNSVTILSDKIRLLRLSLIKALLTILLTTISSWAVCYTFLIPLNICELYPFVVILIFLGISIFFETIIRITTDDSAADFNLTLLIIILAMNESLSMIEAVIICLASLASFILLLFIVHIIKLRIYSTNLNNYVTFTSKKPLVFIALGILIIIFLGVNISWLNTGMLK